MRLPFENKGLFGDSRSEPPRIVRPAGRRFSGRGQSANLFQGKSLTKKPYFGICFGQIPDSSAAQRSANLLGKGSSKTGAAGLNRPETGRGQMAIDLVFALILILLALQGFSSVMTHFQDVQKEISLRQQLRENTRVSAIFILVSNLYFHRPFDYITEYLTQNPASDGKRLSIQTGWFSRATGTIPLNPVRFVETPQGFDCNIWSDLQDANLLFFTIFSSDSGLSKDVNVSRRLTVVSNYDDNHLVLFDSCGGPFHIRGKP